MNPIGKIGVGEAAVAHQFAQDRPIAIVNILDSHNTLQIASFPAVTANIL